MRPPSIDDLAVAARYLNVSQHDVARLANNNAGSTAQRWLDGDFAALERVAAFLDQIVKGRLMLALVDDAASHANALLTFADEQYDEGVCDTERRFK